MKLLIAVPAMDFVHTEFVKCLLDLTNKLKDDGTDFEVRIESGTLVYFARDKLATYAITNGFDKILWLDSDMVFNNEIIEDLEFSGKDFVSGIAHGRRKPYLSCLFKNYRPDVVRWTYEEYPSNTFEVAACGFAAVLMDVSILKAVMDKHRTCFSPTKLLGEDVAFCDRAREMGYHIYAEPGVRLGHIGHITIYPEDTVQAHSEIQGAVK